MSPVSAFEMCRDKNFDPNILLCCSSPVKIDADILMSGPTRFMMCCKSCFAKFFSAIFYDSYCAGRNCH